MDDSSLNSREVGIYLLITNIPHVFHSKDLRNYFSNYVNKNAFHTFHYRHRPEASLLEYLKNIKKSLESDSVMERKSVLEKNCMLELSEGVRKLSEVIESSKRNLKSIEERVKKNGNDSHINKEIGNAHTKPNEESLSRCCALILIKKEYLDSFKALYNRKFWVTIDGVLLPVRCLIFDLTMILKLNKEMQSYTGCDEELSYPTKSRLQWQKRHLTFEKMNQLLEFDTPYFMPQGNVGTPNSYFKSLLDQCKLPASIISKLGLDFNKRRPKKKYSQVHLNYGTEIEPEGLYRSLDEAIFTEKGDLIPGYFDIKFNKSLQKSRKNGPILELEREEEEDGAETEEWDRFEAFHDDVTKQERAKERLFESEIELVWEKGGSGLVFYTDSQFWRVYEGGEEERNVDEWDLDVTPYYERGEGGDLDARASLSMTEMDRLKAGTLTTSVFVPSSGATKRQKPTRHFGHREIAEAERVGMDRSLSVSDGMEGHQHQRRETRKQRHERKKLLKQSATGENSVQDIRRRGSCSAFGNFEEHTKGIGRRVLEAQGWKDGEGLGREGKGMARAVESMWKHPSDKSGFGYNEKPEQAQPRERLISTAFDFPATIDPVPSLYRSAQPIALSHRTHPYYNVLFQKSKET